MPKQTTLPPSPWKPHGPVQYRQLVHSVDEWKDHEKAAYIFDDIQHYGVSGIDSDPWVAEFLKRLLWSEIEKGINDA